MLAAKEWVSVWPDMGFQVYVTSSIFRASMKVILFLEDGFKLLICIMLNWQIYGPLSESRAIPVSRSPVGMIYSSEEYEEVNYLQFSLALTSLHEIFYKPEEKVLTNLYNQQYGNGQHIIMKYFCCICIIIVTQPTLNNCIYNTVYFLGQGYGREVDQKQLLWLRDQGSYWTDHMLTEEAAHGIVSLHRNFLLEEYLFENSFLS